jgi:hypothetical protein
MSTVVENYTRIEVLTVDSGIHHRLLAVYNQNIFSEEE